VVDAIVRAVDSPLTGWNEFHIGSGTKVAVREVVGEIADQLEARDRFVFGARAIRPGEPEIQVADVRHARAALGWVPRIGWREGVRALCAEARAAAAPPRTPQGTPHGGAGGR